MFDLESESVRWPKCRFFLDGSSRSCLLLIGYRWIQSWIELISVGIVDRLAVVLYLLLLDERLVARCGIVALVRTLGSNASVSIRVESLVHRGFSSLLPLPLAYKEDD